MAAALPNVVIIGAMKCGTTALHQCLDQHPEVAMAARKELNFFFGPTNPSDYPAASRWSTWHRGLEWYQAQFRADVPVRGESSPGYTSPDHPEAAGRMAAIVPDARLIYLVRHPLDRALSQYRHHVADGDEHRSVEDALLDPHSHYLARSRYYERLVPFLDHFPRSHIAIVSQERLRTAPHQVLPGLFRFLGIDDSYWSDNFRRRWNTSRAHASPPSRRLTGRFLAALADDITRFRELAGDELAEWEQYAGLDHPQV